MRSWCMVWLLLTGLVLGFLVGCNDDDDDNVPAGNPVTDAQVSVSPSSGTTTTLFTISVDAESDGQPIEAFEVRYDWEGTGTFTPFTDQQTVQHQYPIAGTYPLTVEVRDDEGNLVSTTQTITVTEDIDPVFVQLYAKPMTGTTSTDFTFTAHGFILIMVTQPITRDQLIPFGEIRWDFNDDGLFDTPFTAYGEDRPEEGPPPTITHRFDSPGIYTVRTQIRFNNKVGSNTVTVTVE